IKVARPSVRLNECNVNDDFLSIVSTGLPANKMEKPASSGANVTHGDGSLCAATTVGTLATLTNNSRTRMTLYTVTESTVLIEQAQPAPARASLDRRDRW